jgi:DNA-binding transcriptional LysR family regulator
VPRRIATLATVNGVRAKVAGKGPPALDGIRQLTYLSPAIKVRRLDNHQPACGAVAVSLRVRTEEAPRMELHQVRYFLALCKCLNFTRAAESCNVTQPALTRAIQKLEDELGGPLFYRERSLTQLTELGRSLKPHLEATYAAADATKQLAAGMRKREIAVLRLGIANGVSAALVAEPAAEVARRIPALDLHLVENGNAALADALLQGEVDAALLVRHDELSERLNAWPILDEACCVVFPTQHRFQKLDAVSLSDLADETIIKLSGAGGAAEMASGSAALRVRHSASSAEHAQHLVVNGFGVALVPGTTIVLAGLDARPLGAAEFRRTIVLAVVAGRLFSPALDVFVRLMRARSFAAADRAAA